MILPQFVFFVYSALMICVRFLSFATLSNSLTHTVLRYAYSQIIEAVKKFGTYRLKNLLLHKKWYIAHFYIANLPHATD